MRKGLNVSIWIVALFAIIEGVVAILGTFGVVYGTDYTMLIEIAHLLGYMVVMGALLAIRATLPQANEEGFGRPGKPGPEWRDEIAGD